MPVQLSTVGTAAVAGLYGIDRPGISRSFVVAGMGGVCWIIRPWSRMSLVLPLLSVNCATVGICVTVVCTHRSMRWAFATAADHPGCREGIHPRGYAVVGRVGSWGCREVLPRLVPLLSIVCVLVELASRLVALTEICNGLLPVLPIYRGLAFACSGVCTGLSDSLKGLPRVLRRRMPSGCGCCRWSLSGSLLGLPQDLPRWMPSRCGCYRESLSMLPIC